MGTTAIPSAAVLLEHGLRNVELDKSAPIWISGTADLAHQAKYPLLTAVPLPRRVHFDFCPAHLSPASAAFKRRCQLIALQSDQNAAGPSLREVGQASEIVAWSEDSDGDWLITTLEDAQSVNLVEEWASTVHRGGFRDGIERLRITDEPRRTASERSHAVYGPSCELLCGVLDAVQVSGTVKFGV